MKQCTLQSTKTMKCSGFVEALPRHDISGQVNIWHEQSITTTSVTRMTSGRCACVGLKKLRRADWVLDIERPQGEQDD